jgi:hypothetical protein
MVMLFILPLALLMTAAGAQAEGPGNVLAMLHSSRHLRERSVVEESSAVVQSDYPPTMESAERFFEESNVTLHYDMLEGVGNLFRVTATTPLPIFCSIVWKYVGNNGGNSTATTPVAGEQRAVDDATVGVIEMQVMGSGASKDHNIFLWGLPALDDGETPSDPREIEVRAFGFLSNGRVVFMSPTYTALATKNVPTLVQSGPGDVSSPGLNGTKAAAPIVIKDDMFVQTPDSTGMMSASAFAVASSTEQLDDASLDDPLTVFRADAPLDIPIVTLPLSTLEPNTTYVVGGNILYPTGEVMLTETLEFTTPPKTVVKEDPCVANANLSVTDVSSNWPGTKAATNDAFFGADSAVDKLTTTAWSSFLDGNDASLEVELSVDGVEGPYEVVSIGYWSRMMTDGTAIVNFFRVVDPITSKVLVTEICPLPTFTQMHMCSIDDVSSNLEAPKVEKVRFEVVDSTGGNTGAVEVQVMVATPNTDACLASKQNQTEDLATVLDPEEGCEESTKSNDGSGASMFEVTLRPRFALVATSLVMTMAVLV